MIYWIHYSNFPIIEWGAVATWYVGVLSVILLYETLKSQNISIKESNSQYSINLLKDTILLLLKNYQTNINNINGLFTYKTTSQKVTIKNQINAEDWFIYALDEIGYIESLLKLPMKPLGFQETEVNYNQCLRSQKNYYEKYCNNEDGIDCSKEFNDYFFSVFADDCKKYINDWWGNNVNHSLKEMNKMIIKIFLLKHKEILNSLPYLMVCLTSIRDFKTKNQITNIDEIKTLTKIVEAFIMKDQRKFYLKIASLIPEMNDLFKQVNFLNINKI